MTTVAIRTNRLSFMFRGHLVGYVMPVMTLKAHCVDLTANKDDVRRCGADVFIVGVTCAYPVAAGTGYPCPKMSLTYLFLDKWNMANVTGGISTHGIALVKLC
jgi:hypothetical protein